MAPKTILAKDAKGRRVMVPGIPGEDELPAEVVSAKVVGRLVLMRFKDHPTCGTFSWQYPRTQVFELNEKPPVKGVKKS